jgi:hypothetical protein
MGHGSWVKGQARHSSLGDGGSCRTLGAGPRTPNKEEGGFAMKRSAIVKCLVVTLVMFLFMMLSSTAQAQQKTITLNYSNFAPATHKTSVLSEEWCKEVEKRTNGLVKATMFHGGTLTPPTQAYDGVVKGLSDMAQGVFSYHRGRFPLTEFSDLPSASGTVWSLRRCSTSTTRSSNRRRWTM